MKNTVIEIEQNLRDSIVNENICKVKGGTKMSQNMQHRETKR